MKAKQYFFIIPVIAALTASGCNDGRADAPGHAHESLTEEEGHVHEELPDDMVELNTEQIRIAGIQLGKVEMRQVSGRVKANGTVITAPQNSASVSVPLGGYVKSSSLLPGHAVRKGQVLAIIENTEYAELQQNYLETRNRFEYAEAEFNRHNELYKDDVYSKKNVQLTTSEYRSLKAQLKGMEEKLKTLGIQPEKLNEDNLSAAISLIAPIGGYLKTANISIGKYVSPADVLFEIINPDNLLLELVLFEKDANRVSVGQVVHFTVNNETHEHQARIYQVGKSINADRTYKVYATIQQGCSNVLPGMYVLAHIEKSGGQTASVPAEAVVTFDNKYYICAFVRNKEEEGKPFTEYRFVEVSKGETGEGYTEIVLPAGFDIEPAQIVIKGAYSILAAKKNAGEMSC